MSTCGNVLFPTVQATSARARWESFAVSYAAQAVAIGLLLVVSIEAPRIAPPLLMSHVELVAPDLATRPKAAPVKVTARPLPAPVKPAPVVAKLELPKILKIQPPPVEIQPVQRPQRVEPVAPVAEIAKPQVAVAAPKFDSNVVAALPGPKSPTRVIATNTFGGSSAAATLQNVAPSKVQTGGFGDPNGVPANAHGSDHPNIAAAGSFGLPAGGGYGNGTGGTRGLRGTVASAGFGNGVAIQGEGGRGGSAAQGRLQSTSFGSPAAAVNAEEPRKARMAEHVPSSVPVSIQSKPTPVYTSEARQLRVEGEVLLNVVFTADGQVHILNVVRGLGHGLDEAAQRAAQGIHFTPALRDGHPVDSNVTLHIVFQLS